MQELSFQEIIGVIKTMESNKPFVFFLDDKAEPVRCIASKVPVGDTKIIFVFRFDGNNIFASDVRDFANNVDILDFYLDTEYFCANCEVE